MLDYEEVRFAGDSAVDCWMDLQVGKFPDSTAVTAAVRIGQPLSMLVYAKDDEGTRHEHLYFCLFSKKKIDFEQRWSLIFLQFLALYMTKILTKISLLKKTENMFSLLSWLDA